MRLIFSFITLFFISTMALGETPTLTVYTYRSFTSEWGPGPLIKKEFEKQCDCKLDFVALDDGVSLLSRLRLEGEHTKADIVLGLDYSLSAELLALDLVALHQLTLPSLTVPGGWTDEHFIPFDYSYLAFIYNDQHLKNPPQSIKELATEHRFKVIYEDPRISSLGLGLALWWTHIYTDAMPSLWQQLQKHTVSVTRGWSEAYGLFLKHEADLVLSYTTSPAYHTYTDKSTHFKAALFKEGQFLQIETAAIVKHSTQKKLAQQFLTLLLSEPIQKYLEHNGCILQNNLANCHPNLLICQHRLKLFV